MSRKAAEASGRSKTNRAVSSTTRNPSRARLALASSKRHTELGVRSSERGRRLSFIKTSFFRAPRSAFRTVLSAIGFHNPFNERGGGPPLNERDAHHPRH